MKPSILMTSGYSRETLAGLSCHWHTVDIPRHDEALDYLKSCGELPFAVVIGFVPRVVIAGDETEEEQWSGTLAAPEMLREILAIDADLPVLVSASEPHPRRIVELVKRGAFGYVIEPKDKSNGDELQQYNDELELLLRRAVRWRQMIIENRRLQKMPAGESDSLRLISRSAAMDRVAQLAAKVAPTPATVLITGESGTGKDLLAKRVHKGSKCSDKPFVAINCGALNEHLLTSELFGHVKGSFTGAESHNPGLIRQAGDGTLFLDEVEAISPGFQVLLLRVLEERTARPVGGQAEYPVRCRFIAAANSDLEPLVAAGTFRRDLYYRLNVFHLDLPPLRRRSEDIPLLADFFLHRTAREFGRDISGIEASAMEILEAYQWPGNIRELRNVIERAVILCEGSKLTPADFAAYLKRASSGPAIDFNQDYATAMEQFEAKIIRHALERCRGNVTAAASSLKIKRTAPHCATAFSVWDSWHRAAVEFCGITASLCNPSP